jgi:hypothetical protein
MFAAITPSQPMGIGKVQVGRLSIPQYYLFEWKDAWVRYQDHTYPVKLPPYLMDPAPGYISCLSSGTLEYDFMSQQGHRNIGGWIDLAAQRVGR